MKPLVALRRPRNLTLSSIGQTFLQPDFWTTSGASFQERLANDFEGYAAGAFKGNGIIFTTMQIRQAILGEARFQYQRLQQGRPGALWGDQTLRLLENPWPNGTTGELIARMDQDASLAGNFYASTVGRGAALRIRRLRPDWVTVITGVRTDELTHPDEVPSPYDLRAQPVGYVYQPPLEEPTLLDADAVVHYSPIPDPTSQWRGMSWITAIVREIEADTATTKHKLKFFENGATSNVVVTYDKGVSKENVEKFAKLFAEQHAGVDRAYKTIHLGGGADAKMVGADLAQLDFKVTQGAGESRIAAASLVGAVLAQFSEGMAGSSLNAGNFNASKRRFADVGARPLWRIMAASLAKLVAVPPGNRLWYDDRDIPFLQDDATDEAKIRQIDAITVRQLTEAGYTPDSIKKFVPSAAELQHTGVFSVQLQPPGGDGAAASLRVPVRQVAALLADGWTVVDDQEE